MNTTFILLIVSASALPALAIVGVFLRQGFFKGVWRYVFMALGLLLLLASVLSTFFEHRDDFGIKELVVTIAVSGITWILLSRYKHKHHHAIVEGGEKGIVISEAFHSLFDGAAIGAAFLFSPIAGWTAMAGIITHELPKIAGTLALFRSLGLSIKNTVYYGFLAQIGSPVAAILVYMLGKQFPQEKFHTFEIAALASLGTIVIKIVWEEIHYHAQHKHMHQKEK